MVLIKIFILFCIAVFSNEEELSTLEVLFKDEKYVELLSEMDDLEDELTMENDYAFFELKAYTLERLGRKKEALEIFTKLLKVRFPKETKEFVKSIKKKSFSFDFENAESMKRYLFKVAEIYTELYTDVNLGVKEEDRIKKQRKALAYAKLVEMVKDENSTADQLFEKIDQHEKELSLHDYSFQFYPYLSFLSFQDYITLSKTDNSASSKILNTVSSSCTGLGFRWINISHEWNIENCYLIGSTTAETDEGSLSYSQSSVPVSGFYGGAGYMNHSFAENLSFGGQLNYLYRSGQWDEPSGTKIEEKSYLRLGFSLRTSWEVGDFGFVASIGKIFENKSSTFLLLTKYHF